MTTPNIVPRANGEGSLGTVAKKWGSVYAAKLIDSESVLSFGAKGNGTDSDSSALAAALTSIGSNDGTLYFPKGTYILDADVTIPENVCLKFDKGAVLSIADTFTVTINGPIEAGLWQIFSGTGTVAGTPVVAAVYPEWFGAKADGTTECAAAIQSAINMKAKVQLSQGSYKISTTLSLRQREFVGCGAGATRLVVHGTDAIQLPIGTARVSTNVRGFSIDGYNETCYNFSAVCVEENTSNPHVDKFAIGYGFSYIEINNFGAGFNISNTFRFSADHIGMSSVPCAIILSGQTVDGSYTDIRSNNDYAHPTTIKPESRGVTVEGHTYADGVIRYPEGNMFSRCAFVSVAYGIYHQYALATWYNNCIVDFVHKAGLYITSHESTNVDGLYVGLRGIDAPAYGVQLVTSGFTPKLISLNRVYINNYPGSHADAIGIYASSDSRWTGLNINQCTFRANVKFKYGIKLTHVTLANITNNIFEMDAISDTGILIPNGSYLSIQNNMMNGSGISITTAGTGISHINGNYHEGTVAIIGPGAVLYDHDTTPARATFSELGSKVSTINTSRKYLGKAVYVTDKDVWAYSTGQSAVAPWNDAAGSLYHTPA